MSTDSELNFRDGSQKVFWFLLFNALLSVTTTATSPAAEVVSPEVPELVENPHGLTADSPLFFEWHHFPASAAENPDGYYPDHLPDLTFYQNTVLALVKLQSARFQCSRPLPIEFLTAFHTSLPDPLMTA